MHIDEWLDHPEIRNEDGRHYARFVLEAARFPAWKKSAYRPWMKQFKLFCTYKGERYRCTGASRMGDVWLAKDLNREDGYDLRVLVVECSGWSDREGIPSWDLQATNSNHEKGT